MGVSSCGNEEVEVEEDVEDKCDHQFNSIRRDTIWFIIYSFDSIKLTTISAMPFNCDSRFSSLHPPRSILLTPFSRKVASCGCGR